MESQELLLSVPGVTVYRLARTAAARVVCTAQLDLLVSRDTNEYSLRVADQMFTLRKEMQVLKGQNNSYVLIIEEEMTGLMADPPIPEELAEVLELAFAEACQYIRSSVDPEELERVEIVEAEIEPIDQYPPPPAQTQGKLKRLFKSGKEKLKAGLMKGACVAYVTYLKGKVYLKKRLSKKHTVARPQEKTISLSQAVQILKDIERAQEPVASTNEVEDILQSYGKMSQHLERSKPQNQERSAES